ncbi:hypothetical protein H4R18_000974 [Coemansia javaensis]|uniref:Glutamyl-tRNA(Gln) amidotransferase subunit B, mitochondrial n=1 Tax=Coemansia javaensis TaxID=2761396 RepID=A0A9W8LM93_9FUNG|nr:hypothetical protein H4R18_000974 [Coemansia javaensis]
MNAISSRIGPGARWLVGRAALARQARSHGSLPGEFKVAIGLELHVQLQAAQKLFSAASARWDDAPNTNVSAVDAGLPGALPQLNPECVALAARAVLVLGGQVQRRSAFDRKHYFYADQPLGYQITQQWHPIGRGGVVRLGAGEGLPRARAVRIRQVQLEQDTAKSVHGVERGHVLVDLNRAGVALVEIVSEPDMETAEEAAAYVRKVQALLRRAGVSKCNMEEGSLRCDVNVSVGSGAQRGARCELKNLNSLKTIQGAINAEIARQAVAAARGERPAPETRGYDARSGETFLLRRKETAPDYRYMPEPDVPEVHVTDDWIAHVRSSLPETPEAAQARLERQYGLGREAAATILGEPGCLEFFEAAARGRAARQVAAWITSEVFGQLAYRGQRLADSPLAPRQLADVLDALGRDAITSRQARELLIAFMDGERRGAAELIAAHGWAVVSDGAQLRRMADRLLDAHPKEAAGYLRGQERRLNFFVGRLVQATGGQAKPQAASAAVREALEARRGQA